MGSWGTNQSIPVVLRKFFQWKVVEKGAPKIVQVSVFRAECSWRNVLSPFRAISSRHLIFILFSRFLRLTRALCRSLVIEGSVVHSWSLSKHCSCTVVIIAAQQANKKPEKTCCGTLHNRPNLRSTACSKLAFRRTCCRATSKPKPPRTCQPKLKNVQRFWETKIPSENM